MLLSNIFSKIYFSIATSTKNEIICNKHKGEQNRDQCYIYIYDLAVLTIMLTGLVSEVDLWDILGTSSGQLKIGEGLHLLEFD